MDVSYEGQHLGKHWKSKNGKCDTLALINEKLLLEMKEI